jgi:hypothetical protein
VQASSLEKEFWDQGGEGGLVEFNRGIWAWYPCLSPRLLNAWKDEELDQLSADEDVSPRNHPKPNPLVVDVNSIKPAPWSDRHYIAFTRLRAALSPEQPTFSSYSKGLDTQDSFVGRLAMPGQTN